MTPEQIERARFRPFVLVVWLLVLAILVVVLSGCATRKLSEEEDARIYEACKETGCRMVPLPLWREIEQYFRNLGRPAARGTT